MDIQPLLDHFSKYLPLESEEVEALEYRVKQRRVKRRQFLLSEGEVCRRYTFVVEGCFRMYKIDGDAKEHNLQFSVENNWIADIGSFHSEEPSELFIEALENSVIFQIEKPELLHLYTNFPKFDRNFRVLIEDAYVNMQKRVLQNIGAAAEQRYLDFLESHPDLLNRISNLHIASYIGITPEFLSRLRKELVSK